ncbi:uroporphyrinogen decarboxylase family protein [Sporotomaculum syntrophicum]|uniref:uroporphyrinogen decarboxylase family protein n=1 Tax=Sporotomaculum syntrophicum TaxID=182264 RepID=UPI00137A02CC|nr:uroporphyrinogen decarboxylase family protein [Sporotomaculum syntrophicum]
MNYTGCKLKDQMTPNERMGALMQGKDIDRIPCVPMIGNTAAQYIGLSVSEMLKSPQLIAEAQMRQMALESQKF